jgi:alpha-tubulin suppressor-like RCC1 family protein
MFASEKRKRATNEDHVEELNATPRKQKIKASGVRSPSSPATKAGAFFQEKKRSLWQQHMETLNTATRKRLLGNGNGNLTTPDDAVMMACEYLRVQRDIDQLYHRPAGDVVAMGMDDCSQLGIAKTADDDKEMEYAPTLVRNLPSNTIQVASGGLHSVALMDSGEVYTWGCNDDYALGREVTEETSHLVEKVTAGFDPADVNQMVAIEAGDSHSLFLSLQGNVYMCGMYKDVDSGKFHDVNPGQKLTKGSNNIPVKAYQIPQKVRKIAAGFSWNAAILADDSMVTWGEYSYVFMIQLQLSLQSLEYMLSRSQKLTYSSFSQAWAISENSLEAKPWELRSKPTKKDSKPTILGRPGSGKSTTLKK